jgi:hypothetical protein
MADYNMSTRIINPSNGDILTFNGGSIQPVAPPIPTANDLKYIEVLVSSAQILAMHTTPVDIIAAQGAGKTASIIKATIKLIAGTPYAGGANFGLYYDSGTLSTASTGVLIANTFLASATDRQGVLIANATGTVGALVLDNAAIKLATTVAFTTGTGTLTLQIWYTVS